MLERSLRARALTLRLTLAFRLDQFHRQHPKAGAGAVLVALLGTGMTAFGVAPLTVVDPAPVVTQRITEAVITPPFSDQLEALQSHSLRLHRVETVRAGDTADSLLRRLGIDDSEAARFLRQDPLGRSVLEGRRGRQVRVMSTSGAAGLTHLAELVMLSPASGSQAATHFTRLRIHRDADGGLRAAEETVAFGRELRSGGATIQSTLFAAADAAQLPDAVTEQIAEIFGNDIDFRRDLRRGDQFTVVWEGLTADGEAVSWGSAAGRVLAARFVNGDSTHEAMWFEHEGQTGAYFGLDGKGMNRSFLASPLAFSRMTSGFAMRFHPIQQTWKAHLGVDYAAPTGTPVRAVGDGVVEFAGWQNGYGKVVQIKHDREHATVYAHLSVIDVEQGQKIAQGASIGQVGTTGWSTGPHLHFEFKVDGKQVDPVGIARASSSQSLSPATKARFSATSQQMSERLAAAAPRHTATALARME